MEVEKVVRSIEIASSSNILGIILRGHGKKGREKTKK